MKSLLLPYLFLEIATATDLLTNSYISTTRIIHSLGHHLTHNIP